MTDEHAEGQDTTEGGPPPEATADTEDQPTPEADASGDVENQSVDPAVEEYIHQDTTVVKDD
jgi:hypothetical protein